MKKLSHTFPVPELGADRFCRISTIGDAGKIRATASVYREEDSGRGYKMESHFMFQDYSKSVLPTRIVKRVTDKAVAEVHAEAVTLIPEIRADIIAHYAKGTQS